MEDALDETNARLERQFARQPGVIVTNLFRHLTMGTARRDRARFYRDTLHLQPEAYATLSKALAALLGEMAHAELPPNP